MKNENRFTNLDYKKRPINELILSSENFYDIMKKRRSVRNFSNQPVPQEIIENIILTAGTSPSGANKQPWFFAVIRDEKVKEIIRKKCEMHEKENYENRYPKKMKQDIDFLKLSWQKPFLTVAPFLIIIFKIRYIESDGKVDSNYYVSESSGISLGILFTAINNAGLVTVPYTPMPRAFLRDILELPRSYSPLMILPVGFPADDIEIPVKTTKSLDEIMKIY